MKVTLLNSLPLIVAAVISAILAVLTPYGIAWTIVLSKKGISRTLTPTYYYDGNANYVWSKDDFGLVEFYDFHREHGSRVESVDEFQNQAFGGPSGIRLFLDNYSPIWCKTTVAGWPWPCIGKFVFGEERFEVVREYRGDVKIAGRRLPVFVVGGWDFVRSVLMFFLLWFFSLAIMSEYIFRSALRRIPSHAKLIRGKWRRMQN